MRNVPRPGSFPFLVFLFTVAIVPRYSWAQPSTLLQKKIIFDQITQKIGLTQASINCIQQDREGYLWIGTWSGLVRYDGYTTAVYYSSRAAGKIKSNKITALHEDIKGNLWIGTHMGGLFQYNRNDDTFIHYFHDPSNLQSISSNNVTAILDDTQGNIWVGTENGLNVFDGKQNNFKKLFNTTGDPSSLTSSSINSLFLSSTNDIWIGTNSGINRLVKSVNNFSFERYVTPNTTPLDLRNFVFQITEVLVNGKPQIWFSTMKGMGNLNNGEMKGFTVPGRPLPYSYMRCILPVAGATPFIIVGSEMGLHFFDVNSGSFKKFLNNEETSGNLSQSTISALYFDRGGVLWVGTKSGLNKYDSYAKDFEAYKTSVFDGAKNIITGLQESVNGGYFVSTIGGGLYRLQNGSFDPIIIGKSEKHEFSNFIQTFVTDSRGNIWLGTAGAGVYRFKEAQYKKGNNIVTSFDHFHTQSKHALNQDIVMALEEDSHGNMWVGTWNGGLNKITPTGEVIQYNQPELKKVPLVAIHADLSGVLWVGTRGNGLYRIKIRDENPEIRIYQQGKDSTNALSNNVINVIFEDHGGKLWIGTEDGLNAFDRRTEKFSSMEFRSSPSNSVIVSILEDDSGKLWLAHWNGLTVIDPLDPEFIKNYDIHDRVQGGFFYNNVCFKDSKGRLLFAGSDGFNIINPSELAGNPNEAPMVIQNFKVLNEPVSVGKYLNDRVLLDKPISQSDRIALKHFENTISFEFAALDFAAPDKVRYAYKLDGLDKDWTYTDASRRYVNYTNLAYGNYTFKVKATNNDGVWSERISEINIVIQPPWWKTSWAVLLYTICAMLVLYGFRKLILMRANFIHDIKLERIQRENMEKLNRAKLQFFTNISHEFRTPLTLILGPVQSLIESGSGSKFVRDHLHSISNNAQRLLRLVNQLLDFRKAESGNLKLEVSEGNIVKFLKEIKLSFDALAEQLKIDFQFFSSANVIKAWFDRDQFEKIMFNLLSNAFKHTPEEGKITIRIIEENDNIIIAVEDSGKGVKPEHYETIFQTFFSYDEDRHHTGTGIGLALTKSLVDAHHGTITVERTNNNLTRFTVKMLVGNKHFDESELSKRSGDLEQIESYPALSPEVLLGKTTETDQLLQRTEDQPKLLIVEDNNEVRAYVKSIFMNEFVILEAEDGKEGVSLALEEIPDIIVSDVMMPVMDGISMTRQLKSNSKTSHIPIILLTARTSLIFKVEGLETGADDYVNKPFNPKVLQLKVRNVVRAREVMRKAFRDNDTLTIEPRRVTLTSVDEEFVQKALHSIEKNMSNAEYSVEELGLDVGMSRMQLYRKLKALTGQSANEFIRTIRLKRAAQLLEQNQLTIAEITYEVGFNDLQYFRECFKKLFGATPSEYTQKRIKDQSWTEPA
jgi:signal transduction histidine kinase/ligand-binding sensor domain-containing protein/DNA-binding response OmpR family regulator